jgi:hypothetical protein
MKSLNRDHAKQMNEKENISCQNEVESNENKVTYDQAVKEMEGQLVRLKLHRSRLGY